MGIFLLDHHHHHHHHTHSFFLSFSCPCIAPLVLFFPLCHFVFAVVQNLVASLTDLAPFFLSFFLLSVLLLLFCLSVFLATIELLFLIAPFPSLAIASFLSLCPNYPQFLLSCCACNGYAR